MPAHTAIAAAGAARLMEEARRQDLREFIDWRRAALQAHPRGSRQPERAHIYGGVAWVAGAMSADEAAGGWTSALCLGVE
ncbi:hypothetical protein D9Q98_010063 [Chlorella vulgaris]|uniref:Uncharacterized protein n=1 Tax=Chlorella vulgaris TaxID=3077 RepID=A0A9D4TMU1_CHLVU|nr:hypothetical protein D9Q98_010063 [Chlorella vulgaris]